MPFGQLLIGPPGSGKTTFCNGVQQYLRAARRHVVLLNLDPANDVLPYEPDIDVCDLVCLEQVMAELGLGPNGGVTERLGWFGALRRGSGQETSKRMQQAGAGVIPRTRDGCWQDFCSYTSYRPVRLQLPNASGWPVIRSMARTSPPGVRKQQMAAGPCCNPTRPRVLHRVPGEKC
jgi:hypothetical protein